MKDYKNIKSINPKFPEFFTKSASKKLKKLHDNIISIKEDIASRRMKILEEEKELKALENKYYYLIELFDVEFENKDVKEIKVECNFLVKNDSDARHSYN